MKESRIWEKRTVSLTSETSTTTKRSLSLPVGSPSASSGGTPWSPACPAIGRSTPVWQPPAWLASPPARSLLRSCNVVVVRLNCFLPPWARTSCTAACHGVIGDGVVPHHAKGVGVRMRRITSSCSSTTMEASGSMDSNVFVASSKVSSLLAMRHHGDVSVILRHHVPTDSNMSSFSHTLTFPDEWSWRDFRERRVNVPVNIGGTTRPSRANPPLP